MQDRHRYRAWDTVENRYIYNAEMVYDTRGVVAECFGYMLDGTYGDSYIVEQCTGLKDKNGKLIYEGDIVKDKYGEKYIVKFGKHTITIPVGYENGETECWGWYLSKFTYGFIYLQEQCDNLNPDNEYLIIGNIHENPELSEEYKKNTQS
jgi:uncharacterized phage protein (TIGR01671 family)